MKVLSLTQPQAILGIVTIIDFVEHHPSPWFFGPYGFVLKNPSLFRMPIPYKGQLKIFDVPDEVIINGLRMGKAHGHGSRRK